MQKPCTECHKGNPEALNKIDAHKGLISRPSRDINVCASCHKNISDNFKTSLHYTTEGLRKGIHKRFSQEQARQFDSKVFEQSCRSCHATCGDCHVKTPVISGINQGLFANHRFQKKNVDKTCAACHGGRVYTEFTGKNNGIRDIHFEKGMTCTDCHKATELHGNGIKVESKLYVKDKPSCTNCHKLNTTQKSITIHKQHAKVVSCQACHVASEYNNCSSCHIGKGASQFQSFILGRDPVNKDRLVTLRLTPAARDTFASQGIDMDNYDKIPNFFMAPVHNIRNKTPRTRTCSPCHTENKEGFINEKIFPKNGSKQNSILLYDFRSLKIFKQK